LNSLLETLNILWQIYQSLISHDIPQYLVDNAQVFQELLCKYLVYENPAYSNSNYSNDEDIGNLEHVKIEILEIINLYIQKYYEDFPQINSAVRSTWDLVTRLDARPKFDLLTSKALTLLSTAVKNRSFQTLFGNPEVLSTLSSNVIIPNATLREVDEELFTDEPMEYIKRDLEGTDSETRRRSAADLVRSLLMTFQKEWTELFTGYIHTNLDLYKSDPVNNWKNKDTAIFLLSSIATTKQATSLGVTTSNEFIDVANIFSTHILPDLQPESQAHPILKVDSIKYLFTFRNQLTAEQLFSMLPLLIFHLGSDDQLVHTYAAVAIERILAMKSNHKSVFTSESLKPLLENLLTNLFNLTFKSNSAQQVAENDYLMKTIMRTVIVAGPAILPYSALLAKKLSDLLKLIASNPSNPKYSHYAFEAIGACIRLAKNNPENFLQLESAFQDTFQLILTQNIEEFIPYALQILAQVLTFHPTPGIPDFYQNLLTSVLQPVLWQKEGNVPALTRLLRSYLVRSAKFETQITQPNVLNSILGIFQKLISSKINESYGFELVREIFIQIPIQVLQPYLTSIANLMLSRLQKSKTNKFVYEFTLFVSVLLTANKPDWNPDFAVRLFESIQQNLFSQLTQHFIVNTIPLISGRDNRKLVIAGMVSLLTQTNFATVDPLKQHWSTIANNVMTLLQSPEIVKADVESELQQEEELIRFEVEETTFSTAFVNLATSSLPPANPAVGIPDISAHAVSQLQGFNHKHPGFVRELASQLPEADSNTLINQFHNLGINV
jgi:exportin-2 (importin alpha re-exporter)